MRKKIKDALIGALILTIIMILLSSGLKFLINGCLKIGITDNGVFALSFTFLFILIIKKYYFLEKYLNRGVYHFLIVGTLYLGSIFLSMAGVVYANEKLIIGMGEMS